MKMTVGVSPYLYRELQKHKQLTGKAISDAVDEALNNWLQCVAPTEIDAVISQAEITDVPQH